MKEIPKWAKKFQRISWEPEILISGGLLFTLLQAPSTLIQLKNFLTPTGAPGISATLGFIALGISALTIGFGFHLITKAFWIALLALKSVFPDGINFTNLNYSERFLKNTSIHDSLDSIIIKIGNTSSLMFVISFLFLMMFLGIGIYVILIIAFLFFIPLHIPIPTLIFFPLLLPFIDFVTFGGLKKGKVFSKIYYPYYKLISWMTLSFLYRNILYTLISNIPKRRLVYFTILFMIPTALLTYRNVAGFTHRSNTINEWSFFDDAALNPSMVNRKYENLRESDDPIATGTIHSDVIAENHVKLYLRYTRMDIPLKALKDENQNLSKNQILNKYFDVKIDEISVDSVHWNFTRKKDINQFGLVGFIPILDLEYGPHVIEVSADENLLFAAPFWKE